jgi:hypothetical protein
MSDKSKSPISGSTDTAPEPPAPVAPRPLATPQPQPRQGLPDMSLDQLLKFVAGYAGSFGGIVALTAIVVLAVVLSVVGGWLNPVRLLSGAITLIGLLLLAIALVNSARWLIDPASNPSAQHDAMWRLFGLASLLISAVVVWNVTNYLFGSGIRDMRAAYAAQVSGTFKDAVETVSYEKRHCPIMREEDLEALRNDMSPSFLRDIVRGNSRSFDKSALSSITQCEIITLDRRFDIGRGPYRHDIVLAANVVHFTHDAVLRIGNRRLYIIANRLLADPGARIEAFDQDRQKSLQEHAQDAGHVRIILLEPPVNAPTQFTVDLRGEDGRDGDRGQDATPARVAWQPRARPYDQRLVTLFSVAPPGVAGVEECSEAENKRRMRAIDWAALGPVYSGPVTPQIAEVRRLVACAEQKPGDKAVRDAAEIRKDFSEIETALATRDQVTVCLRTVDRGLPGAEGQPQAINGSDGRPGGRGGTVVAVYPDAPGGPAPWLSVMVDGGTGGFAGAAGRPQAGGDGEPAISAPAHLSSCRDAPEGPPGKSAETGRPGAPGSPGANGRNSSVPLPSLR